MSAAAAPTSRYKTVIFQVYTCHIPVISLSYTSKRYKTVIFQVYTCHITVISLSYTFKGYMHGIYLVYTWYMTIYVVTQVYTSKKLYGFVPYQSRTLLDM